MVGFCLNNNEINTISNHKIVNENEKLSQIYLIGEANFKEIIMIKLMMININISFNFRK